MIAESRQAYAFAPRTSSGKGIRFHTPTVLRPLPHRGIISSTSLDLSDDEEEYDPRDNFGRSIRGLQSSALKDVIEVGDTVVCKRSVPNLGIYADASYDVRSIYTQYFDDDAQQIVRRQFESLNDATMDQSEVYMTLYSPQYHTDPQIVTPEEVGLISVKKELGNAAWLAVPGFFWVFVAASFYNTYHDRTGGSIGDAFWGR